MTPDGTLINMQKDHCCCSFSHREIDDGIKSHDLII
jgi:hypothetical protein